MEEAPDSDLAEASAEYRKALGAEATHQRLTALRQTLAAAGFVTFHSFTVALANRGAAAGSTSESDAFFLSAIHEWSEQEARLGVELDARVIAYRLSRRIRNNSHHINRGGTPIFKRRLCMRTNTAQRSNDATIWIEAFESNPPNRCTIRICDSSSRHGD